MQKWVRFTFLANKRFCTRFKNWRKFARYCGIKTFRIQLWKQYQRQKQGKSFWSRTKDEMLLHLLALTSIRHDPELKLHERKRKKEPTSIRILNKTNRKQKPHFCSQYQTRNAHVKTHQFCSPGDMQKIFLCFDIEYVSRSIFTG